MKKTKMIGITSTVPIEAILAAGYTPVDLNNRFIAAPDRDRLIAGAEARGFPVNLCAWIKGIYQAARAAGVDKVVGVVRGDCSSTEKLLEIWRHEGLETYAFSYPPEPDPARIAQEISSFAQKLGAGLAAAEKVRERLLPVRSLLFELDDLTWKTGQVRGSENHSWLVSASDFQGDPQAFQERLAAFLDQARQRKEERGFIRLGYAGVPPVLDDLYAFLEELGARVVLNEVQRQFAMISGASDLARQYSVYTYPYDTFYRLADIEREAKRRDLHGIIHYAQTFCHRQMEAIILRERLRLPVLTVEADKPGPLDARTRTRLQAFIEQLADQTGQNPGSRS